MNANKKMNGIHLSWMDEEQCLTVDEYAAKKCTIYEPNWIQSWMDHDPAGVVVSVEPIERWNREHQVLVDLAHLFFREAGCIPTRLGTIYTWRYRLEPQVNTYTPSAYDVSCYDDDHEHPVVVCLFYCRRDSTVDGADLEVYPRTSPSWWWNRLWNPTDPEGTILSRPGTVVVMEGGRQHVHTPCGGRGDMHVVAVALYRDHPEENVWTERW